MRTRGRDEKPDLFVTAELWASCRQHAAGEDVAPKRAQVLTAEEESESLEVQMLCQWRCDKIP